MHRIAFASFFFHYLANWYAGMIACLGIFCVAFGPSGLGLLTRHSEHIAFFLLVLLCPFMFLNSLLLSNYLLAYRYALRLTEMNVATVRYTIMLCAVAAALSLINSLWFGAYSFLFSLSPFFIAVVVFGLPIANVHSGAEERAEALRNQYSIDARKLLPPVFAKRFLLRLMALELAEGEAAKDFPFLGEKPSFADKPGHAPTPSWQSARERSRRGSSDRERDE
jgi:hypothetical protein